MEHCFHCREKTKIYIRFCCVDVGRLFRLQCRQCFWLYNSLVKPNGSRNIFVAMRVIVTDGPQSMTKKPFIPVIAFACWITMQVTAQQTATEAPTGFTTPTVPIANLIGSVAKTVCRSVGYREFEIPFRWLASPDLQAGSSHANFRSRLRRSWRTHAVA
jgi:hypothetical protein